MFYKSVQYKATLPKMCKETFLILWKKCNYTKVEDNCIPFCCEIADNIEYLQLFAEEAFVLI